MDPAQIANLPSLISSARFSPYVAECGGNVQHAARLYTWNIQISAAFWGPLHAFEVTLRNALHNQLSVRYRRADWWLGGAVRLNRPMSQQLNEATSSATRRATVGHRTVVPDDVVAALSFGFWTGLLGSGSQRGDPHLPYETRYWQPALHKAFPHYRGARADLHRDLDYLRVFRNRIDHHEPVFRRHLAADHATLSRLAGYIAPNAQAYLDGNSRVPTVLSRRSAVVLTGRDATF